MRDRHPEFVERNIKVAVVGQGTHEDMRAFLETRPVPYETFADPERTAKQLHLLAQGAIATAVATGSPEAAKVARVAAGRILH